MPGTRKTKSFPARTPVPISAVRAPKPRVAILRSRKPKSADSAGTAVIRRKAPSVLEGQRVGTKKNDTRWRDPAGRIWASQFEYRVFSDLCRAAVDVQKVETGFPYTSNVRGARCGQCGSVCVVQDRVYTPDLLVSRGGNKGSYYIEAKGYMRAERRRLLREFVRTRPDMDLRFVIQRDYKVGKGTLTDWAGKYLKVPVHVWNGDLPEDWK